MRSRRAPAIGLATVLAGLAAVLAGSAAVTGPGQGPAAAAAARVSANAAVRAPRSAVRLQAAASPAARVRSSPCAAFGGARQLPGADGVTPAAWSGGGLVVPACGPVPGEGSGERGTPVYAYPGAQWTAGYQCVEFSERYLYDRYGVTMGIVTNGDQVAAHYAAAFSGLFMIIRNGTPHRVPAPGDVLSLSAVPGFDSASGGHTAVVQSSAVDAAGSGTVTIVEENGAASGVAVLTVTGWTVRYPGFRYLEWLTTTGQPLVGVHSPSAPGGRPAPAPHYSPK